MVRYFQHFWISPSKIVLRIHPWAYVNEICKRETIWIMYWKWWKYVLCIRIFQKVIFMFYKLCWKYVIEDPLNETTNYHFHIKWFWEIILLMDGTCNAPSTYGWSPILINVVCMQWNFPHGIRWWGYRFGRVRRAGCQVRQRENSTFLFHVVEIRLYHRCDDQRELFAIH